MGGLIAGREGHDVIAHISSHTVCVRVRGSVSQSISMALLNHKQSVCGCVMLRVYSHNHPEQ